MGRVHGQVRSPRIPRSREVADLNTTSHHHLVFLAAHPIEHPNRVGYIYIYIIYIYNYPENRCNVANRIINHLYNIPTSMGGKNNPQMIQSWYIKMELS